MFSLFLYFNLFLIICNNFDKNRNTFQQPNHRLLQEKEVINES